MFTINYWEGNVSYREELPSSTTIYMDLRLDTADTEEEAARIAAELQEEVELVFDEDGHYYKAPWL